MAAPTITELALTEKFRARIQDLALSEDEKSDMQLVRWIRARENDLDKAESMFRKEENDMDNILTWKPPEMITDLYPVHIEGFDIENTPIVIFPMGRADLKGLIENGYMHDIVRYMDQCWERAMARMKGRLTKEGVAVTQFTCIVDMDQLSFKTAGSLKVIEYLRLAIGHFDSNYPEIFRKCFIINSSRAFQILFAVIGPLLSPRTFGKIEVLTTEHKWKPKILADIPANQLPEYYGGTTWSILDSFVGYKSKQDPEALIETDVGAGEILRIPMHVSKEKCTLKWAVGVEDFDIDFSVRFNEQEIVRKERLASKEASVLGSLDCYSAGIYTFLFDNSYSRFRSKTIKYCIQIAE